MNFKNFIPPRPVNPLFAGRDDVLTRLCTHLNHDGWRTGKEQQTRIAITGIAGLGKSELCLKLLDIVWQNYQHILWVDVANYHAAEQDFKMVRTDLTFLQQSWLLVLDNADDPQNDYAVFFPPGYRGTIIITSRILKCGRTFGTDHHEQLDILDRSHATDLLLRSAKLTPSSPLRPQAEKIAERLGDHTLAIISAGTYIRQASSFDRYLKVYEENWRRTASYTSSQDRSRYGSVPSTFEASIDVLTDAKTEANSDALDMLCVLSCLAADNVPLALFEGAWQAIAPVSQIDDPESLYNLSKWHIAKLPDFLKSVENKWDSYRVTQACIALAELSLVTVVQSEHGSKLSMHPLIHDFIWHRQDRQQMERSWIMTGSILSLSLWNDEAWFKYADEYRLHLGAYVAARRTQKLSTALDLPMLQVMYRCAYALDRVRDDRLALECSNTIATSLGKTGEADAKYESFNVLRAKCLLRNGDASGSIKLLEHILKLKQGTGEHDSSRLASQHVLASAYLANGQVKEAITLLEHAVEIAVKMQAGVPAENDPILLALQHALASAYQANGRVKEAVTLLEHVVKIQAGVYAENDPNLLASQHTLASAYLANEQVTEAITLLKNIVKIKENVLTEDDPSRLASQYALADAYQTNGQVEEAKILLQHVVKIEEGVLTESHPNRLASQHALASVYLASRQVKEAIALFEHVVKIQDGSSIFPESHTSRLDSQHALGNAYQANGQVEESITLLQRVIKVKENILPEDDPSRLKSQYALASAYQANGQVTEAITLFQHVVKIEEDVLPENDSKRLASQHALAIAYQANKQVTEAISLYQHVVKIQEGVLPENDSKRLASQHALAIAYQANKQVTEAITLLQYVVKVKESMYTESNLSLLASQHALGNAYLANKQVKEAINLLEHVVDMKAGVLQQTDRSRQTSQKALINAYRLDGQIERADKLERSIEESTK